MNIEEYFKNGYYIGKTQELFDDYQIFLDYANKVCEFSMNPNLRFKNGFLYRFEYPNSIEEKKSSTLYSYDEIYERENHLKKMGYKTIQRWWESSSNLELGIYKEYFREKIHRYVIKIYPELDNNIIDGDAFTIYENGDFIEPHCDGTHPERCCVILLYLSDKKDYIDGGGRLIIGDNDTKLEYVEPTNDNFALLDFKNHNLKHAVEMVKNNFKRFTYINFINNKETYEKIKLQKK